MRAWYAASDLGEQRSLNLDKLQWFDNIQDLLNLVQEHDFLWAVDLGPESQKSVYNLNEAKTNKANKESECPWTVSSRLCPGVLVLYVFAFIIPPRSRTGPSQGTGPHSMPAVGDTESATWPCAVAGGPWSGKSCAPPSRAGRIHWWYYNFFVRGEWGPTSKNERKSNKRAWDVVTQRTSRAEWIIKIKKVTRTTIKFGKKEKKKNVKISECASAIHSIRDICHSQPQQPKVGWVGW